MRDWEAYVAGHREASVYHVLAWRDIVRAGFGYQSWYLLARNSGNGLTCGALPLFLVRTPFSRRLVAVPFRDRGGVLWDTPEAFSALVRHTREIACVAGASVICLKSVAPYPEKEAKALGLTESRYWVRSVANIDNVSVEDLWRKIGAKNRNMVRQAQKRGLECEHLQPTADNLSDWHRLHVVTQQRLGIPPFPLRFFTAMADCLQRSDGFALLGVRGGKALHSATILLLHRETAIYAYSASDHLGQDWRANDLMLFQTMRFLIERRIRTFDMGSDSPLQDSLLFFKRKWLAQQAAIPHYNFGAMTRMDSSDAHYRFARRVLSLMPRPVLTRLGTAISRYFG